MPETKFNKGTDTTHKVKLESALIHASWISPGAICGQEAAYEVGTAMVGEGAPIKLTFKTESGKKLDKVSGKIRRNKYIGKIAIPDDLELDDEVYFEVKLSKNSLKGESDRIPVCPPIVVKNMKWSAQEAKRGDELTLSADLTGVHDGEELTVVVYEYDPEGAHDKVCELPAIVKKKKIELKWEFEYFDDTDDIPDDEDLQPYDAKYKVPEFFFAIKAGNEEYGREQESGKLKFKDAIELLLKDEAGQPLANANYKVIFADSSEKTGSADGDGKITIEDVPPGPYRVILTDEIE